MIVGRIHTGSGLGNQLHRYVMTRILALDLGVDFGFEGVENFKGSTFMNLDWGKPPVWDKEFEEERINKGTVDVRPYDKRIKDVKDGTRIDGEFQASKYWQHHKEEVKGWLKVLPCEVPRDGCIIAFRGGEYKNHPDLYLPQEYWDTAIKKMEELNPRVLFHVVTDDVEEARKFFPKLEISHDIEMDYRLIASANYLILSNSSFAIFPALLGNAEIILAPRFWAGRNVGYWKLPQNKYKEFTYV